MRKYISNRLHATWDGGQTALGRGIHFDFSLEFYTPQYMSQSNSAKECFEKIEKYTVEVELFGYDVL